jgi:uncharacterized protein YtpQ (UPF0354 family)
MTSLPGQNNSKSTLKTDSWPDVKNRIYPMIKPASNEDNDTSTGIELKNSDLPIIEPYLAELHVVYVIDNEGYYTYVNSDDLKQWNINKDSLSKTAMENLNILANGRAQFHGDSTYGIIVLNGNFEASLMLSDGFWEAIAQTTKQKNLVIGIPAKDVLLITHLESSEGIRTLKQAINKIYEQGDHLITKWLFKRVAGVWSKFEQVE